MDKVYSAHGHWHCLRPDDAIHLCGGKLQVCSYHEGAGQDVRDGLNEFIKAAGHAAPSGNFKACQPPLGMLRASFESNPRYIAGTGLTGGELPERVWSFLNGFASMTRSMTSKNRHLMLSDAVVYYCEAKMREIPTLVATEARRNWNKGVSSGFERPTNINHPFLRQYAEAVGHNVAVALKGCYFMELIKYCCLYESKRDTCRGSAKAQKVGAWLSTLLKKSAREAQAS